MDTPNSPLIEVHNLQAHYGPEQVLFDVDLEVLEGEVMVIMGGSGSGKSTLLRHLLGLERPSAGQVLVLGSDMARLRARDQLALRRQMGVAFHCP